MPIVYVRPALPLVASALVLCASVAEGQSGTGPRKKVDSLVGIRPDGSWQVVPIDSARLDSLTRAGVILGQNTDEEAEVLTGPQIRYPDRARRQCITGRVIIQVVIGRDGRPEPGSVRIRRSIDPQLDQSALDYAWQASFKPGKVHGQAVRTLVNIPIDFKIRGAC